MQTDEKMRDKRWMDGKTDRKIEELNVKESRKK